MTEFRVCPSCRRVWELKILAGEVPLDGVNAVVPFCPFCKAVVDDPGNGHDLSLNLAFWSAMHEAFPDHRVKVLAEDPNEGGDIQ